jgi:hypothetical protein
MGVKLFILEASNSPHIFNPHLNQPFTLELEKLNRLVEFAGKFSRE